MARPEDSRVKIPALVHFTRLGYQYMSIKDMVRGVDYDSDTNIFYGLFLDAINKINNTDLSLEEAKKILAKARKEKLPIVDADFNLKGLITIKDIEKTIKYPLSAKDD